MPDVVAAVTDTHALAFHAAGGRKLGKRAAAHFTLCERQSALLYVPAAVIWEMSLLLRIGRIEVVGDLRTFFETLFSNPAYQPLDLTPDQIYIAGDLPLHSDPFDALICAAAVHLGLPLVTRDGKISDSGVVSVLW